MSVSQEERKFRWIELIILHFHRQIETFDKPLQSGNTHNEKHREDHSVTQFVSNQGHDDVRYSDADLVYLFPASSAP